MLYNFGRSLFYMFWNRNIFVTLSQGSGMCTSSTSWRCIRAQHPSAFTSY